MNSIKDNINKQNKVRHRKRGEQGSSISDKFSSGKELQNRPQMIKQKLIGKQKEIGNQEQKEQPF